MIDNKSILLIFTSLCVILVWVIRLKYPDYFQKNPLVAPIVTVLILVSAIMIYKKMCESSSCSSPKYGGAPGSCELDTDCNGVNKAGSCIKILNPNTGKSVCQCKCKYGWSGPNCETKGIPWDSPFCMGSNKQHARKDKNGLCVCPEGNWSPANTGDGMVQCGQCTPNWGPFSATGAPNACTSQWSTVNLPTNDCYTGNSNATCDASQFPSYFQYAGPQNVNPSATLKTTCDNSDSCRCAIMGESGVISRRGICSVTAWVDPNNKGVQTCGDINTERNCTSYNCNNS
jgi:hypothetical protein